MTFLAWKQLENYEFARTPKILVGSRALIYNLQNDTYRNPKDTDFLLYGEHQKFTSADGAGNRTDAHGIPEELFGHIAQKSVVVEGNSYYVPNLDTLYTLKVSHAAFDIHWEKTMWDINFMQEQGCKLDEPLYDKLYEYWLKVHSHKKDKVNLNKSNEEFFKDGVKRVYVHDDLHEAVKYYSMPMYKALKHDPSKAKIDKDLFDQCTRMEKYQLCREEIYVTALERFHIPTEGKIPDVICYRRAIKKLVTSMTKGWFPQFIITHYKDLKTPDKDYVNIFKKALSEGKIKTI